MLEVRFRRGAAGTTRILTIRGRRTGTVRIGDRRAGAKEQLTSFVLGAPSPLGCPVGEA